MLMKVSVSYQVSKLIKLSFLRIPANTKIQRLEENLGAINVKLTKAELQDINKMLELIEVDETHF